MGAELREPVRLADLAELVGGRIEGDDQRRVEALAVLEEAGPRDLSFCGRGIYRRHVASTGAAAVLVSEDFEPPDGTPENLAWIRVADPYLALAALLEELVERRRPEPGIDPTAVLADDVEVGEGVHVGAGVVLATGVRLGPGTAVHPGCVLGEGVVVGRDCLLHASVTLYEGVSLGDRVIVHSGAVLGADGFGYARDGRRHVKIPQVGGVEIADDVEIGANACVDRGTLGPTRIGPRTKIDNMVQIGHNCTIGADCAVSGQVGLGGTTRVGDGVLMGGQAGFAGHLRVGDGARIAGRTGVISDVPSDGRVAGYPHQDVAGWRRAVAAFRRLPELLRRVRRLEKALAGDAEERE